MKENRLDTYLDLVGTYNKLGNRGHGELEDACYICGISPRGLKDYINQQRTNDLKKLAFHTGISVEDLEGFLRSKTDE